MQPARASIITVLAIAGLSGACPGNARAVAYSYTYTQAPSGAAGVSNAGGFIDTVKATFDSDTKRLGFSVSFGPATGQTWLGTRGFWMVMSDGPMPRDEAGRYGIFYFDAASLSAPRLTVYSYDGSGTPNSYLGGDLIRGAFDGTYVHSLMVQDKSIATGYRRVMSFDVDATSIINHAPLSPGRNPWFGAGFGPGMGLWLYPVLGFAATYGPSGGIGTISYFQPGWFTASNLTTEPGGTPTPGAAAVLGLGGALCARRRRRAG